MSKTIESLLEIRKQHTDEMTRIAQTAALHGRDLSEGEQRRFDEANALVDRADERIAELRAVESRASELERSFEEVTGVTPPAQRSVSAEQLGTEIRRVAAENSQRPFYLDLRNLRSGSEARALATTSGTGVPVSYAHEIVTSMVASSGILAAGARLVTTTTGEPFNVPRAVANSTASIIAEGGQITESDPTVDVVELGAYKYGFLTGATHEMLNDSSFDVVSWLAQQTGEQIGVGFGADLANGNGTGKPSGVVGASTVGATGSTGVAGACNADNLIDLQHSLPSPYQRNASWVMSSAALGAIRKLKDTAGRFLFEPVEVQPGDPSSGHLLGRPVYLDDAIPAPAATAKSVLYGDFTRVWVRQVASVRFERSDHAKFDFDTVVFRGLHRLDGALVDTGAVRHFAGGAA